MKKMMESFSGSILSRNEQKMIFGMGSATAGCGLGNADVTCNGSNCKSIESVGCSCSTTGGGTDTKKCAQA